MASLKEIAESTGLSIRTVSRALRGVGSVKGGTRERILECARRLNYRPNLAARSLRTGKSHNLTVLVPTTDELAMNKIAAFEETTREAGYTVDVSFVTGGVAGNPEAAQVLLEQVLMKRPAGVMQITAVESPDFSLTDKLLEAGIPTVCIDFRHAKTASVCVDRQQGVYESVHYLARTGRKRIAFLGPVDLKHARTRLDGYDRALQELEQEPQYLSTGKADTFQAGREAALVFLSMATRPDAVQVHTDLMALGFLAGLYGHGVCVPRDVAVVGFDNRGASALSAPPLTTVAQPNRDVGRCAAELLLRKISGQRAPHGGWSVVLPTRLEIRETA